jgi:N-acyl-phosphatidylethanolamine-hydrolysing phospholipase D
VISHNHYDHLDYGSVQEIEAKFGCAWFVPAGMKQWMMDSGCKQVEEFDWWEERSIKNVKFTFTPAQHWSARGLTDRFKVSWTLYTGFFFM